MNCPACFGEGFDISEMTILPVCGHALCRECWQQHLGTVLQQHETGESAEDGIPAGMFRCIGFEGTQRCPSLISFEQIYALLGVPLPPQYKIASSSSSSSGDGKKGPHEQQAKKVREPVDPVLQALWDAIDSKQILLRSLARRALTALPFEDVQYLDEHGRDVLIWASTFNNSLVFEYLVANYAAQLNPNLLDNFGRHSLLYAAQGGFPAVAEKLLALGADPTTVDKNGKTALEYAIALPVNENSDNLVKVLVEALRSKSAAPPSTILFELAHRNRSKVLTSLLTTFQGAEVQQQIDINITDAQGKTPLHYAANAGATDSVRVLLNSHALCDIPDSNGATPLILATKQGCGIVASLLLNAGANFRHKDGYGYSPLTWVAQNNDMQFLPSLLDRQAGVDDIFQAMIKARGQGATETAAALRETFSKTTGPPSLLLLVSENILRKQLAPPSVPLLIRLGPSHAYAQHKKD